MNILAIDTSTKFTCVGICKNDNEFFSENKILGRKQSELLNVMTENILRENNLTWPDLDYIALTNGPGYFTGIRTGAAYVKGLAFALNIKIIPVESLEFLKYIFIQQNKNLSPEQNIIPIIYAGHDYVYASGKNLSTCEYSHENLKKYIAQNQDAIIISDDGAKTGFDAGIKIYDVEPNADYIAKMALSKIEDAVNPVELVINYYRQPQGMQL